MLFKLLLNYYTFLNCLFIAVITQGMNLLIFEMGKEVKREVVYTGHSPAFQLEHYNLFKLNQYLIWSLNSAKDLWHG